ncbi:MAG: MFS transporter, partial [Methanobacteriota archaeon]
MKQKTTFRIKGSTSGNVFFLGLVSLFNDIASEMIYPIIPLYLTTALGAPVSIVGIIEGIAEATASILKGFSGHLSDRLKHRKNFVVMGYALSTLSRIVLAISSAWWHVLTARFIDRFGKGTRTSARDALIADSTQEEHRGAAFGFHRAMDTVGAVIGPLLALLFLTLLNERFSLFFWIAVLPSLVGVLILWIWVKEPAHHRHNHSPLPRFSLKAFPQPFKMFLLVNIIFALGNSSDAFLILRAKHLGFSNSGSVMLYVVFNIVYAFAAYPLGKLSDRWGAKKVLTSSFLLFTVIYTWIGVIEEG